MDCKKCGAQIEEKAKVCPSCGKKVKRRKPLYKKVWFWILAGILSFSVFMSAVSEIACGENSSKPTNPSANNPSVNNPSVNNPATTAPKDDIIKISASDLLAEYDENEVAADNKYKGKKVEITGSVDSIGKDILGSVYVTLKTDNGFVSIQCYFSEKAEIDKVATLKEGDWVTVTGIVDGRSINVVVKKCKLA